MELKFLISEISYLGVEINLKKIFGYIDEGNYTTKITKRVIKHQIKGTKKKQFNAKSVGEVERTLKDDQEIAVEKMPVYVEKKGKRIPKEKSAKSAKGKKRKKNLSVDKSSDDSYEGGRKGNKKRKGKTSKEFKNSKKEKEYNSSVISRKVYRSTDDNSHDSYDYIGPINSDSSSAVRNHVTSSFSGSSSSSSSSLSEKNIWEQSINTGNDLRKFKLSFKSTTMTYLAGYLLKFMRRLLKGDDPMDSDDFISLFVATWNVGNTPPDNDTLQNWIPTNQYDIYVIGAQEAKYEKRSGFSSCNDDWSSSIANHIGKEYVCISAKSLWEIRLLVYVRLELMENVSLVDNSKEATGLGNVMGNKGGVCVSFKYNETTFCFLNSHLAAHQEKVSARNKDVQAIIDSISLTDKMKDISTQFNHIFWMGDLNYRIKKTREEVIDAVNKSDISELLIYDQLNIERRKKKVFFRFKEGEITFNPTYKFDNHQPHNYYSEERNRVPSWCDRILWSSWMALGEDVEQLEYDASYNVITSDHVPVHSVFRIRTDKPTLPPQLNPRKCVVVLKNLRGTDLLSTDSDGFSDPYLEVSGKFFVNKSKTGVLHKTLNPQWEEELALLTVFNHREFLERASISITVKDKDQLSSPDLVGRCTLGLKGKLETPHEFEVVIRKHGLPAGTINGTVEVFWV